MMLKGLLNTKRTLQIIKDDFISFERSIESQVDDLYEDMFQATLVNRENYVIDVGWYGDNYESGNFICYLIRNEDWDQPVEKVITREPKEVVNTVNMFISKYGIPSR